MIETTIGEMLHGEVGGLDALELGSYRLSVIRDGETIFYVDQPKRDPITSLRVHLGRGSFPTVDNVGDFVKANAPQPMGWTVKLHQGGDTAEENLIRQFKPCLNVAGSQQLSEIPRATPSRGRRS
jgi:hypothetical protein